MREIKIGILLLLPFCIFSKDAMSQRSLKLATVDKFPPFSFMENGRLKGVDVDVVYEMAKRLRLRIEFEAYPWARVMAYVKDGTVDGGVAAFLTDDRKVFCYYTGVLHYEEFHVFVKKGNEFSFSSVRDLYGKTVGKDIGVYVSKAFEKAADDGKMIVENVNDLDLLNLKKLSLDRIDAMIGDHGVTIYHAEKLGMADSIVSLGPVHEKQASYLVLSKKSDFPNIQKWQKKITSELLKIWEDGTYQTIINRYTSKK